MYYIHLSKGYNLELLDHNNFLMGILWFRFDKDLLLEYILRYKAGKY